MISGSTIVSDGGAAITERGVVFATTAAPTTSDSKVTVSGTTGAFDAAITGLSSSTEYFVRAFATNSAGTSYGSQVSFTTSTATAIVETTPSSLSGFNAVYGSASSAQSFSVNGVDLTGDLTVTAPAGFEVSLTSGSGYGASVILVQETGNVSATVFARLASGNVPADYSGDIVIEGGSADAVQVTIPSSTVSQKALTVSNAAVTSKIYNGSTAATITGDLVGILDGDTVTLVGTGTFASADVGEGIEVTSTSTLAGVQADRYTLTQPTGLTGNITIASQTITFNELAVQDISAGSMVLTASSTSGLTVSFASSNTAVATVSGSTVTFVSAGSTTITASQGGNSNYNAATPVDRSLTISAEVLIAGWDFQTTTNGGTAAAAAPGSPDLYRSNFGIATLYLDGTSGSSDWITATSGNEVTSFGGTTVNAGSGFSTTTSGASSLTLLGGTSFSANGKFIVFAIDMANREDLNITYASQRTGTGFNSHIWAYSTDLENWTSLEAITTIASSFAVVTVPTITGLDGVKTAYVRLTVNGATSSSGNNRLDNIQFRATENKTITLTGTTGYRLLSSPVSGTYNTLLGGLWTQGFTGADATNGMSNVYRQAEGNALVSLTDQSATYPAGYGVAVGVYADDDASTPGVQGGFPKVLPINGTENAAPVAITPAFSSTEGEWEYVLAGNPFWSSIDWELVTKGADVASTIWVWNPTAGDYASWNGSIGDQRGGIIAAGQGFFAAYDGPASGITFTEASKSTGGSFRGKEVEPIAVRIGFRGEDGRENGTWLQFAADGTFGRDRKDAIKFAPFSNSVHQVFTLERETGTPMDIHYLPLITERLELPLGFRSSQEGTFTLNVSHWTLPAGWKFTIREQSGESTTICEWSSQNVNDSTTECELDSRIVNTSSPFVVVVEPVGTTSVDSGQMTADSFKLNAAYPNPFNPSTIISYSLRTSHHARLAVYDLLGREVAVLVDGVLPAGSHSVNFNASGLSSGIYLVRLESEGQVATQRVTLLK